MRGAPRAIVLATRSAGKLRELRPLFERAGFVVRDLEEAGIAHSAEEDDLEHASTFEENALSKARYFFARAGAPVVADDSGLAVHSLGGAPGVRSKRWSGFVGDDDAARDAANNAMLIAALRGATDRRAHYVCAAAVVDGAREVVVRGETTGSIVELPRGADGFGYDPYFLSDDLGVTFGEASREAKERVSHRGRAFALLLERLRHTG